MKAVCFLLPSIDTHPCGGYKIVYEYANRLVARGWEVTLAYGYCGKGNLYPRYFLQRPLSALSFIKGYIWQRLRRLQGGLWFKRDPRIRKVYPLQFSPRFAKSFPSGTRFIATYITTVMNLDAFDVPPDDKANLIQDFESWEFSPEEVSATYRYKMHKIVISNWLADKVKAAGADATLIPNGLDFDYFKLTQPIEGRCKYEIAMSLAKFGSRKRTEDAIAALKLVKAKHPELHVTAFAVRRPAIDLPNWFTFKQCPDRETHNGIYNTAAIYVASSEFEGWGLPPCEAMQCGAAVACTDIGGYRMFAKNGETALMSPVRDPQALADNICRLIEDDDLRIRIAEAGHKNIQQFTWKQAVERFEDVLQQPQ